VADVVVKSLVGNISTGEFLLSCGGSSVTIPWKRGEKKVDEEKK
jgi:hypothetical protein